MVFASLPPESGLDAAGLAARIAQYNVKVGVAGARRLRMVTHYWIDDAAVDRTIAAFKQVLGK